MVAQVMRVEEKQSRDESFWQPIVKDGYVLHIPHQIRERDREIAENGRLCPDFFLRECDGTK